ncbi:MAG: 5-formyltetrahydrofolate cyclo-ligase [Clostridia bacterium]|nr:5-formyltetrahydrofolate cyclo-ligase [Clostridia bacterium]
MEKKSLRKEIRARAELLSYEYKSCASKEIQKRLIESSAFKTADKIFIYVATEKEPDTSLIISEALKCGKKVFVPKCIDKGIMIPVKIDEETKFSEGFMGIREPLIYNKNLPVPDIDLAVIPCVSANKNGNRLGHGGGFYDIFLSENKMTKICLCFNELLHDDIPTDEKDIQMDTVITEKEVFYCK